MNDDRCLLPGDLFLSYDNSCVKIVVSVERCTNVMGDAFYRLGWITLGSGITAPGVITGLFGAGRYHELSAQVFARVSS